MSRRGPREVRDLEKSGLTETREVVWDATLARKKKEFMPKGVRERKYVFSPPLVVTDDID